jgi:hypothetical protein
MSGSPLRSLLVSSFPDEKCKNGKVKTIVSDKTIVSERMIVRDEID